MQTRSEYQNNVLRWEQTCAAMEHEEMAEARRPLSNCDRTTYCGQNTAALCVELPLRFGWHWSAGIVSAAASFVCCPIILCARGTEHGDGCSGCSCPWCDDTTPPERATVGDVVTDLFCCVPLFTPVLMLRHHQEMLGMYVSVVPNTIASILQPWDPPRYLHRPRTRLVRPPMPTPPTPVSAAIADVARTALTIKGAVKNLWKGLTGRTPMERPPPAVTEQPAPPPNFDAVPLPARTPSLEYGLPAQHVRRPEGHQWCEMITGTRRLTNTNSNNPVEAIAQAIALAVIVPVLAVLAIITFPCYCADQCFCGACYQCCNDERCPYLGPAGEALQFLVCPCRLREGATFDRLSDRRVRSLLCVYSGTHSCHLATSVGPCCCVHPRFYGQSSEAYHFACCCESDVARARRWRAEHTADDQLRTATFLTQYNPEGYAFVRRHGHLYVDVRMGRTVAAAPAALEIERVL